MDLLVGQSGDGRGELRHSAVRVSIDATFVRKAAKTYDTAKLAEGSSLEGRRVVVEDVVTSGGEVVVSTMELRARGAVVDVALCVLDREEGGRERPRQHGVELRPLLCRGDLEAARSTTAAQGGHTSDG